MSRHTKLLRKLFGAVAKRYVLQILSDRIIEVETVLIGLHPVVFLRVEMYALYTAIDALLVQPSRRLAIHLLRHRVVNRVVHALLQPEPAAISLLNLVDAVVAQRGCILVITEKGSNAITIVSVQAETGTKPYIPLRISQNTIHHRVRQPLTGIHSAESHVGNHRSFRHHQTDAEHRQKEIKTFHIAKLRIPSQKSKFYESFFGKNLYLCPQINNQPTKYFNYE